MYLVPTTTQVVVVADYLAVKAVQRVLVVMVVVPLVLKAHHLQQMLELQIQAVVQVVLVVVAHLALQAAAALS